MPIRRLACKDYFEKAVSDRDLKTTASSIQQHHDFTNEVHGGIDQRVRLNVPMLKTGCINSPNHRGMVRYRMANQGEIVQLRKVCHRERSNADRSFVQAVDLRPVRQWRRILILTRVGDRVLLQNRAPAL